MIQDLSARPIQNFFLRADYTAGKLIASNRVRALDYCRCKGASRNAVKEPYVRIKKLFEVERRDTEGDKAASQEAAQMSTRSKSQITQHVIHQAGLWVALKS